MRRAFRQGIVLLVVLLLVGSCRTQQGVRDGSRSPAQKPDTLQLSDSAIAAYRIGVLRRAAARVGPQGELLYQISDEYALQGNMDSALHFIDQALALDSTNYYYWDHRKNVLSYLPNRNGEMVEAAKKCLAYGLKDAGDVYTIAQLYMKEHPDSALMVLKAHEALLPRNLQKHWMYVGAYVMLDSCDRAMAYARRAEALAPNDRENIHKLLGAAGMCHHEEMTTHLLIREAEIGPLDTKGAIWTFEFLSKKRQYADIERIARIQYKEFIKLGKKENAVMIGAVSAHYTPKDILEINSSKLLYDSIFRIIPTDMTIREGVLSYYEKIGDNHGLSRAIRAYTQDPLNSLAAWQTMGQYEARNLLRDSTLAWGDRTHCIRSTSLYYPGYYDLRLFYLNQVGEEYGVERQLDSIESYINQIKSSLRRTSKRDTTRIPIRADQELVIPLKQAYRSEISDLYSMKGDALSRRDRGRQWEKAYETALDWDENNYVAMNNYAYFLATHRAARLQKARRLSEKSLAGQPDNPSFLDTYGYILFRLGKYEEAKKVFSRLFQVTDKPGSVSLQHYSDLLKAMGNRLAAEVYAIKAENAKKNEKGE